MHYSVGPETPLGGRCPQLAISRPAQQTGALRVARGPGPTTCNDVTMTPGEVSSFLKHVRSELAARVVPATVPLLAAQNGTLHVAGTGTLIRVAGEGFLVTASHVAKLQTKHGFELAIPVADGEGISLGGVLAWATDDDRYDVAVVRLVPEATLRLRQSEREFLSILDTEDIDPTAAPDGGYALLGFPEEAVRRRDGESVGPVLHYLGCMKYRGPVDNLESSFRPDTHFLLSLDAVREQETGAVTNFPHPEGMSGCSVWWLYAVHDVVGGWKARYARWVGVQSAYFEDHRALKIVPWSHVRALMRQTWPELKAVLTLEGPGRFEL
jgi:hypothetical protein